jgi:hypothetical protein
MSDAVETLPVDETELHTELARHGIQHLPPDLLVMKLQGLCFLER